MKESFYYFFSATPQVLAAILALFGVFIIFKIQVIKTELLALGKFVFDKAWYLNQQFRSTKISKKGKNITLLTKIKEMYERKKIDKLKVELTKMEPNDNYDLSRAAYFENYYELNKLIKRTILWSIFTAFIIIFCLSILPFDKFILNHDYLLYLAFGFIIVCIIVIFGGLILILRKSLSDN